MTSERKIAANRQNSRRSSGPRSTAGARRASRNSLRHGLAAITHRPPAPTGDIERLARAICEQNDDPLLFNAAVAVAENHFLRHAIREQQIAVVERLRDKTAIALTKGDNSLIVAKAKFMEAWLANREIEARVPELLEKYKAQIQPTNHDASLPAPISDNIVPIRLKALLTETDPEKLQQRALDLARKFIEELERDEFEAVEGAIPDLKRLDRYERRAWSRQKRAIREFMNIKYRCGGRRRKAVIR
jgi:hypothetical protein